MSNVNHNETNENNSDFMDCIKNVAKEMAHSLKKTKFNNDVVVTEQSLGTKPEKRKSILDIELPENMMQSEKRNKSNNNINDIQANVVMFDRKESFVINDYNDLFSDDDIVKKVANSTNKDFYRKTKEGLLKKEKKLETLRNKKKEEDLSHFKNRPKINKLSQKINEKNLLETKPIQTRTQEIVEKKYLKIDKLKQIYREIEEMECSQITSRTNFNEKKFEEWLNKQSKWESKKKSKIVSTKKETERLETENMKSMYHPTIDKKSEKLIKSKVLASNSSYKNKELIYDKLYNLKDDKYNKIVQKLVDNIPTFTPIINKRLPNFNKAKQYKNYNNQKIEPNSNSLKTRYNSVEIRNNFDIIYEENDRNEGNYNSVKNQGVNTSMNSYYNPLNDYNSDIGEEEEPDLISRYRKALVINNNINNYNQNSEKRVKKEGHNCSFQEVENNDLLWQNSLVNIKNKQPNQQKQDLRNNSLYYKINVTNASAWDKKKENCIMYNPKNYNIKTLTNDSAK